MLDMGTQCFILEKSTIQSFNIYKMEACAYTIDMFLGY